MGVTAPVSNAVRLWLDGARNVHTIALESGISVRQVQRQLIAAGVREPRVHPQPKDEDVVRARLAEGMPVSWAIEATDVSYERGRALARALPGVEHAQAEWKRVWQRIAITPVLLEQHNEVAPPTVNLSRASVRALAA